jgi:hypothetical protein
VLYIKDKGSELWGRHLLPPRHNSKPYTNKILTKDDIVKHFNENTFNKETSMENSAIEKINDHFDKNSTIQPDGTLRVKGLNELNRNPNKSKPFFGDILEFALKNERLPTDDEVAQMPKQGDTPSP